MTSYPARVNFRLRSQGWKLSGPPAGAKYAATAVAVMGLRRWTASPHQRVMSRGGMAPLPRGSPFRFRLLVLPQSRVPT